MEVGNVIHYDFTTDFPHMKEELEQMQSFFVDQAAFLERQQAASDTLQDWLRWLLLLLLLLEVLWVLKRLLKPEASPT